MKRFYGCVLQRYGGGSWWLGIYRCNNLECTSYAAVGEGTDVLAELDTEYNMLFEKNGTDYSCTFGETTVTGTDGTWQNGWDGIGIYYANVTFDNTNITRLNITYEEQLVTILTANETTNSLGVIPKQTLWEYYLSLEGIFYYNNYTINATYNSSYNNPSKQLNLTGNIFEFLTLNWLPDAPLLYSPNSGSLITLREPTLVWNNSADQEGETLTYHLVVSNQSSFTTVLYDISLINETPLQTNYTTAEINYSYLDQQLFWKVRAHDGTSYSDYSKTWNFTVLSVISATLVQDTVSFGTMSQLEEKDTLSGDPAPFIIENNGNVKLNISINATNIHEQAPNPSEYYMYGVAENEADSYEIALTSWTNFTLNPLESIFGLKYKDASDSAKIHLKIKVPSGEHAGNKTSTITVTAALDE